jgi:hypothetical protein
MKKGEKNPKNENQCRKKLDTNCNVKNTKIGLKFEKTMEKRRKLVEKTMPTMPKRGGEVSGCVSLGLLERFLARFFGFFSRFSA